MAEVFSPEIQNLVKEMLQTDCEKRPSINKILEKPFILHYIKINLVKESDLKKRLNFYKEKLNFPKKEKENNMHKVNDSGLINLKEFISEKKDIKEKEFFDKNESYKESIDKKESTFSDLFVNDERTVSSKKEPFINSNSTINQIDKMKNILEKLMGKDEFNIIYNKATVNYFFYFLESIKGK